MDKVHEKISRMCEVLTKAGFSGKDVADVRMSLEMSYDSGAMEEDNFLGDGIYDGVGPS